MAPMTNAGGTRTAAVNAIVMIGGVLGSCSITVGSESSERETKSDGNDGVVFVFLSVDGVILVSLDGNEVSCKLSSGTECCSDSIAGGGGAAQGLLAMVG